MDTFDVGRVILAASTPIAGVAAVNAEAMVSLTLSRDGVAGGSGTSLAITANKRLRITSIAAGVVSTAAALINGRIAVRMNPAGAAVVASPMQFILPLGTTAALAGASNALVLPIPDGLEFTGTMQIGVSQVFSATTGTLWVFLQGYEYWKL